MLFFPIFSITDEPLFKGPKRGGKPVKKAILLSLCLLIFQNVAPVAGSDPKSGELPRAFLTKRKSNIIFKKHGESISLWSNGSTLEEIFDRIAEESKVVLKFYCQDPPRDQGLVTFRISGDSIGKVLRQLLSEDHRFTFLNREGKPAENEKEIAAVNIYPKECTGMDAPARIFIAAREHPVLRKPPEQISQEELEDVLKRGGPAARSRAAESLGIKMEERGIMYAMEALSDENPGVMLAAANALKRLGKKYGPEKVVDFLYEGFREKPYPELLFALAELDPAKIWPIIDGSMDQPGGRENATLTRILVVTHDRRAIHYLSKISRASTEENSKQAIYAIGMIGGTEGATLLMGLLRGGDARRQAWAAQAVHFLSEGEGMDARAEVEKMVREEGVSDLLLDALVEEYYLEPLEKLIKDPTSKSELKIRASRAMAERATEKTIEIMGMGLNDDAPQVRSALVEVMKVTGLEEAVPYLIRATVDKDSEVRRAAVRGLSEFPWNDRVVEALDKALDDADETVRREAVDALVLLRGTSEAVKDILKRCLNHEDPYVAKKAGSILSNWGLK